MIPTEYILHYLIVQVSQNGEDWSAAGTPFVFIVPRIVWQVLKTNEC